MWDCGLVIHSHEAHHGRRKWRDGGTRPPQSKNQRETSPGNYVISVSFFVHTYANFAFSNIFKIKWPKSEEKLVTCGILSYSLLNKTKHYNYYQPSKIKLKIAPISLTIFHLFISLARLSLKLHQNPHNIPLANFRKIHRFRLPTELVRALSPSNTRAPGLSQVPRSIGTWGGGAPRFYRRSQLPVGDNESLSRALPTRRFLPPLKWRSNRRGRRQNL